MTETFDVVLVGFGLAGAIAASEAHDRGASVIILEKQTMPGGTDSNFRAWGDDTVYVDVSVDMTATGALAASPLRQNPGDRFRSALPPPVSPLPSTPTSRRALA